MANGKLDKELGITAMGPNEDKECTDMDTAEGNVAPGATGSESHKDKGKDKPSRARTPWLLNKAMGKEATALNAFSQQNWGGQTALYHKSITYCSVNELRDILAAALCSLATTDGHHLLLTPSADAETDPQALMCKPITGPCWSLFNRLQTNHML